VDALSIDRLCNLPRAQAVIDRAGYDALVALQPHHVLYLTNYAPMTLDVRWDVSFAAVLPRDTTQPTGLVVQALELLFLAELDLPVDLIETYLAPMPDAAPVGEREPAGVPFHGLRRRANTELPPSVAAKLDISLRVGAHAAATAAHALARLLCAARLEHARIVTDDARTPMWLAEAGLRHVQCTYDPAIFKEIRVVKSAAEIKRLRESARANEGACRAVAACAEAGMTARDLERLFAIECAQLGNRAAYLASDLGSLPHGYIVPGEPVMLDALSTRDGYYGDFGRTLIIGDVNAELRRRAEGLQAAWQAARAAIRPGSDYESIKSAALAGARAAGFPEFEPPVPHCLGLQHTDDPAPPGRHTGMNPNRILEPGMVLNLDMPFIEWGWGTLHREDTWLVTNMGCELFTHDEDTLLIAGRRRVPATLI
jgi:Xaa-Pro aminopeptidase